jgi:succinate dehydrogenase/fumarate reductase-like Fe-S protein
VKKKLVHAKIFRYSPEEKEKRIDTFKVPHRHAMTVQTMLRYIYENIDPRIAFRDFRCGRGVCNTCRIKMNGKIVRSCETPVVAGQEVLLEPANDRIIKDLVVQFD